MIILGLTGSLGMGKSATATLFAEEGVPVYDADAAVHALYADGGAAVPPIRAAFPAAVRDGAVDREALSRLVLDNGAAMRQLESIVHPLVSQAQKEFLRAQQSAGAGVVVLDIPLLMERGTDRAVDAVVVVSAPEAVQRERVLSRPNMSLAKMAALLARQIPDDEKRERADFVINTGHGLDEAREQVRAVLAAVADAD
jgi:dephospho-CoA kinase